MGEWAAKPQMEYRPLGLSGFLNAIFPTEPIFDGPSCVIMAFGGSGVTQRATIGSLMPSRISARAASSSSLAAALSRRHWEAGSSSNVTTSWPACLPLKYIQNALFVSESTVKSHLRSIYRKCDTHNRDEIIALFEREAPELV